VGLDDESALFAGFACVASLQISGVEDGQARNGALSGVDVSESPVAVAVAAALANGKPAIVLGGGGCIAVVARSGIRALDVSVEKPDDREGVGSRGRAPGTRERRSEVGAVVHRHVTRSDDDAPRSPVTVGHGDDFGLRSAKHVHALQPVEAEARHPKTLAARIVISTGEEELHTSIAEALHLAYELDLGAQREEWIVEEISCSEDRVEIVIEGKRDRAIEGLEGGPAQSLPRSRAPAEIRFEVQIRKVKKTEPHRGGF